MSVATKIELISPSDYLAGELDARRKHEYAAGRVYMMAGGRNQHNAVAMAFLGTMFLKLRGKPCQPFNSDTKVRVRSQGDTRFYYPDGMVVCEPNAASETFQDRPVVIAEVLSPRTRRIDEVEKREAYLTIPTLSAYLMIETTLPRVVAHERAADGQFAVQVYEGLDASIDLPAIGTSLTLAELYERVDFAAAAEDERTERRQLDPDDDDE
jgi:Uma2 family endonuclease